MYEMVAENIGKKLIHVKHKELERALDSDYKSICPKCKKGLLLFRRDDNTLMLLPDDVCILCGQHFIYDDVNEINMMERGCIK